MEDHALLRQYIEHQSGQAFAELVQRHLPFVYANALRLVRDPQAAEDVAQSVFIRLARKPWAVFGGHALPGWLYRATQRAAFDALRSEKRRRQREAEAVKLAEQNQGPAERWEQLAPDLDEAMQQLSRIDQDAVLLHYFHGKGYREVGQLLGLKESAAHKRVERALEKIRSHFARRGMTTTAALLSSALAAHAATPMPIGLVAKVTGASLAHGASTSSFGLFLYKILLMNTKTKIALSALAVTALASIPITLQYQAISRLDAEVIALGRQNTSLQSQLKQARTTFQGTVALSSSNSGRAPVVADISKGGQPEVHVALSTVGKLNFQSIQANSFKLTDEAINLLGLNPVEAQQMQEVLDTLKNNIQARNLAAMHTIDPAAVNDPQINDFFNTRGQGQKSVFNVPSFTNDEATAVQQTLLDNTNKVLDNDRAKIFVDKAQTILAKSIGLGGDTTVAFIDGNSPDGSPTTSWLITTAYKTGGKSTTGGQGKEAVPAQLQDLFQAKDNQNEPTDKP